MTAPDHITIAKHPVLPKAQNYDFLRQEGIRLIEKLGSSLWTDYNIHDPGITILETLSYVLTDLSYRASFEVKDLLAEEKPEWFNPDLQALFTARDILTTAPWTINDYRRLLIDLEGIQNAWIRCSKCNCGPKIYVDCKESKLTYEKPKPPEDPKTHEVVPKGLYDVLLELAKDEEHGDLNTGKVTLAYNLLLDGSPETLRLEVRFPSVQEVDRLQETNPLLKFFRHPKSSISSVNAKIIADKKGAVADLLESRLISGLRGVLYVTFEITFEEFLTDPDAGTTHVLTLKEVPFRFVLLPDQVRKKLTLLQIREILSDSTAAGVAARYQLKVAAADEAIAEARQVLLRHRNITEDFCRIEEVEIEEIGVCADLEVAPDADIEQVLSEAFYLIEEYLNPTIRFYTLQQQLEKRPVDEIFDGPKLKHGFIEDEDLERSILNRTLYASDIINLIMDIPGVQHLNNFVLVRFNKEGKNVGSDAWKLEVKANHLPRFYLEGSKFLVFKNGLPFLPDTAELLDTMHVVRGRNLMPKLKDHELDLPVLQGAFQEMQAYEPVQNSLPQVYGTGYEGLPSTATELRKAQAKQLKSYLYFFEQVLANYLGQLANLKHLFSLNNQISQTSFPVFLVDEILQNDLYDNFEADFYDAFSQEKLQELTESKGSFLERRNRFLDHLLARFSESFSDYTLLLYAYKDQKEVAKEKLIGIKTAFLKQFPYQSAYKAQSFDYTAAAEVCLHKSLSGLQHRISALLGLKPSLNYFDYTISRFKEVYSSSLSLHDEAGNVLLTATTLFENEDRDQLLKELNLYIVLILKHVCSKSDYIVVEEEEKFYIQLKSPSIAAHEAAFDTQAEAEAKVDELVAFANQYLHDEQFMLVEHLLLRPQKTGDALLPVCVESDCSFCGEEDPYSYRITLVFDGETDLARDHFEFRRFAEQTIRAEMPAHVMAKICWVTRVVYAALEEAFCAWLSAPPKAKSAKLADLVTAFGELKSIYPPPTLHDCVDGNDENRVYLNHTAL
ncbi:hypothetical protein FVR03_05220 [Pontibacter qinzhouensis]|uniref:Uncharacterized protein n=1 Tax=Pontibacter qinzhouensis TaxID=2603253 RepID=A0A5C8K918_9BACT|nr:hypothetical protein [Pontibacter qinzhouensis]TXK50292.1 hypothetical protein FVR03_05220 [Pontibacter qinzhouensis]